MMRATEVDVEDIRALLAELNDAGGHIDKDQNLLTARPASRRVGRGYVGETSTLRIGQVHTQHPGLRPQSGGKMQDPFRPDISSPSHTSPSLSSPQGSPGFSTYSNVGLGESEQFHRSYVAPLNVRLAPLGSGSPAGVEGGETQKEGGMRRAGSPACEAKMGKIHSSTPPPTSSSPVLTLNPLPALPGGLLDKGVFTVPNAEDVALKVPSLPAHRYVSEAIGDVPTGVRASPSGRGGVGDISPISLLPTKGGPPRLTSSPIPGRGSPAAVGDGTSDTAAQRSRTTMEDDLDLGHRESNFLPIMCARYLRPAGITPPPSWGHTLTPLTDTGPQLLLFGGVDIRSSTEAFSPASLSRDHTLSHSAPGKSSSGSKAAPLANVIASTGSAGEKSTGASSHSMIMMFHMNEVAWEPLAVLSGEPPASRHSHAACAYDGHFLVVYGGQSTTDSGVLFGDVHLFDVHAHTWKCLWQYTPSSSQGKKNVPTPRYGHSMVLRHHRLYIYGGRVYRNSHTMSTGSSSFASSSAPTASSIKDGSSSLSWASPNEVYVFSINTRKWKRRIHVEKTKSAEATATATVGEHASPNGSPPPTSSDASNASTKTGMNDTCPPPRAFHAACAKGNFMYINGGEGPDGCVYNDTWCLELTPSRSGGAVGGSGSTGKRVKEEGSGHAMGGELRRNGWVCLHAGHTVDAAARSRHHLFICGEALLAVGGCASGNARGGGAGPAFSDRLTGKFFNFAAVLPIPSSSLSPTSSPLLEGGNRGEAEDGSGSGTKASRPSGLPPSTRSLWMPVAMGNAAIVSPNKRSFSSAFCGGFVYVFGGQSGSEPGTNVMIRFLAADGYTSSDMRGTREGNDQALRNVLLSLRGEEDQSSTHDKGSGGGNGGALPLPFDAYAMTTTYGAVVAGYHDPHLLVGMHRSIISARAPKFWDQLLCCRHDPLRQPCSLIAEKRKGTTTRDEAQEGMGDGETYDDGAEKGGDALDALLQHTTLPSITPSQQASMGMPAALSLQGHEGGTAMGQLVPDGMMVYYTVGNSRVEGLSVAAKIEDLRALVYYLYCADLPKWFSLMLEDDDDDEDPLGGGEGSPRITDEPSSLSSTTNTSTGGGGAGGNTEKERIRASLQVLQEFAKAYTLPMLQQLCEAYSSGKRRTVEKALLSSTAELRSALLHLLDTGKGATVTVLFADPHTKEQSTHALHPAILMGASSFFTDLLRPLYLGQYVQFQIGPVAAKVTIPIKSAKASELHTDYLGNVLTDVANTNTAALLTSSSKRSIIVGPISISKLAVLPILRFMYSQVLQVPKAVMYSTMLGANQLDLPLLRGYCESVVAREEVNYETCCGFYYISRKYQTFLLEEMSLITAASGYSTVRYTSGYKNLLEEDRQRIDDVAKELGSSTWAPPPAPTNELKTPETYAERWRSSAGVM